MINEAMLNAGVRLLRSQLVALGWFPAKRIAAVYEEELVELALCADIAVPDDVFEVYGP